MSSEQVPTKEPVCFVVDFCIIYQRAVSWSCDLNRREVTTVNCLCEPAGLLFLDRGTQVLNESYLGVALSSQYSGCCDKKEDQGDRKSVV